MIGWTKLHEIWFLCSFWEGLKVFINKFAPKSSLIDFRANWISYLSGTSIKYAKRATSQNRLRLSILSLGSKPSLDHRGVILKYIFMGHFSLLPFDRELPCCRLKLIEWNCQLFGASHFSLLPSDRKLPCMELVTQGLQDILRLFNPIFYCTTWDMKWQYLWI